MKKALTDISCENQSRMASNAVLVTLYHCSRNTLSSVPCFPQLAGRIEWSEVCVGTDHCFSADVSYHLGSQSPEKFYLSSFEREEAELGIHTQPVCFPAEVNRLFTSVV